MLSTDQSAQVGAVLANVKLPDMTDADAKVLDTNNKLKKKAWMVLGTGGLAIVVCVAIIYAGMRYMVSKRGLSANDSLPNMPRLAFSVAVCFASVIGIEFLFLFVVAKQFNPLDSNAVKLAFIKTLINIGNPSKTEAPSSAAAAK